MKDSEIRRDCRNSFCAVWHRFADDARTVLSQTGAEGGDRDKLGRGTLWREDLPLCLHQNHIFCVRFDQAVYEPEFLSVQVGSGYGKAYFLKHAKQTTRIASINQTVLKAFPLPPPMDVQRAVTRGLHQELRSTHVVVSDIEAQLSAAEALPGAFLGDAFAAGGRTGCAMPM